MEQRVNVHHSIQIVEMESVSIINTVETANVIMVKLLEHVHRNALVDVETGYVVQWNTVETVQAIVSLVQLQMYAETALVIVLKIQQLVHKIVEIDAEMQNVILEKPVAIVLMTVDYAKPIAVIQRVIHGKTVNLVPMIVVYAPL